MEVCCSACQITSRPSEYDIYRQSDEDCLLTRDQTTNCRTTNCIWKLRIITLFLTVLCFVMIGYLIYLQSLLGTSVRELIDHGAVAADNVNCSKIGTDVLKEGGNAVDAAVASVLCMTVVAPYKTGLGGGGIAMVYNSQEDTEPLVIDFATNTISGALETAKMRVPSVLRGLEFLHNLKGNLPWGRIVQPAEKLAKEGFFITKHFSEEISKVPDYSMLFGYLNPGGILEIPHLGDTLEAIKNHGSQRQLSTSQFIIILVKNIFSSSDSAVKKIPPYRSMYLVLTWMDFYRFVFYNGSLALKFLRDEFDEMHHDLLSQLANYEPIKTRGRKSNFYNYAIYTPEHSELFHSSLETIERLNISVEEILSIESQLKIARTLIQIKNQEGNLDQETYTAVVAADSNKNLVSIVTGLSVPLGLGHMTGAGFLLDTIYTNNNLQLLTPVIFHSNKNPQDHSGAFGLDDPVLGTEILVNLILQHANLSTAIETQRYYHLPDGILMEPSGGKFSLDQDLISEISRLNQHSHSDISRYSKSVNGVMKEKTYFFSHSDSRGGGVASRYK